MPRTWPARTPRSPGSARAAQSATRTTCRPTTPGRGGGAARSARRRTMPTVPSRNSPWPLRCRRQRGNRPQVRATSALPAWPPLGARCFVADGGREVDDARAVMLTHADPHCQYPRRVGRGRRGHPVMPAILGPAGDVAEWLRQRPAKPSTRVRFPPSPPTRQSSRSSERELCRIHGVLSVQRLPERPTRHQTDRSAGRRACWFGGPWCSR